MSGPHLEHRPDVLDVRGRGEGGLDLTDALDQRLGGLCHLLHLLVVQQSPLLLIQEVCDKETFHGIIPSRGTSARGNK